MPQNKYQRFGDFAEGSKPFEGDKKRIDDILNQEILITDFKIRESKKRQDSSYATIQFQQEENNFIVFTGSTVLIDQLEKYKNNLPFYTTIKKIDRYYTFT
jgi:hypothetical protein